MLFSIQKENCNNPFTTRWAVKPGVPFDMFPEKHLPIIDYLTKTPAHVQIYFNKNQYIKAKENRI